MKKKYFISFVEEMIMNEKYKDYVGGRIEIYVEDEHYSVDEIRFFTKRRNEYYEFRDKWDFKDITEKELKKLKEIVRNKFYNHN